MRIGIFGDSAFSWHGFPQTDLNSDTDCISWNDKVCEYFNASQYNKAVHQGSAERILCELKDSDFNFDLVLISIPHSDAFYLPNCNRDLGFNSDYEYRAELVFKQDMGDSPDSIFNITAIEEYPQDQINTKSVREQFSTLDEFIQTLTLCKKHLYNHKIAKNRHAGALIQIDSLLRFRGIKTLYSCPLHYVPPWVKLEAGPIFDELYDATKKYRMWRNLPNNITLEGQEEISKLVIEKIISMEGWLSG